MSNSDLTKPRSVGLGATAAPLLIVGAMVLMSNVAEPRSSAADVAAPPDPESIIRASFGKMTEAQDAALAFCNTLSALGEDESPFPLIEEIADPSDGDLGPDGMIEEPPLNPAYELALTAVMASSSGNIALINGKAFRENAELGGGWSIETIDAQAKHVILRDGDGKQVTLKLNRNPR